MPPPALNLIRGKKGGRGMPPLAIGPEWSAGRRECPRKLLDPMPCPEGEEVVPSPSLCRR